MAGEYTYTRVYPQIRVGPITRRDVYKVKYCCEQNLVDGGLLILAKVLLAGIVYKVELKCRTGFIYSIESDVVRDHDHEWQFAFAFSARVVVA